MADQPPSPDRNLEMPDNRGGGSVGGTRPSTPRWVKVFGVIALLVLVLAVVILVTGGGNHGPGRHTGSGDRGGETTPIGALESDRGGDHRPPQGGHTP